MYQLSKMSNVYIVCNLFFIQFFRHKYFNLKYIKDANSTTTLLTYQKVKCMMIDVHHT
jgi:hypothetical protein